MVMFVKKGKYKRKLEKKERFKEIPGEKKIAYKKQVKK